VSECTYVRVFAYDAYDVYVARPSAGYKGMWVFFGGGGSSKQAMGISGVISPRHGSPWVLAYAISRCVLAYDVYDVSQTKAPATRTRVVRVGSK